MRIFFLEKGSFMEGFGGYLKLLTVFSTIFGGVLYYVPTSRSYFRKGCYILIDLVALSLKSVLNSFDAEIENANPARVIFPNDSTQREYLRSPKKERRQKRQAIRAKDVKAICHDVSTVQLYPGRGLQLQKYFRGSPSQFAESEIYMLKEPRNGKSVDVKWNQSTIRGKDDDALFFETDNAKTPNSRADVTNHLNKRKSRRPRRDETEIQKLQETLRKLRRRIRSIATVPDQNFKEEKKMEALAIIEELLTNNNYKIDIKQLKKNIKNNRSEELIRADDITSEGTVSSEKKFRGFSRPGSPRVVDIPTAGIEDLYADENARPVLVNDRFTPMMKNAFHWIFGTCPASH